MVNPAGLTTDLAPLQPVPFTLILQVKEVRIHLLVEVADAPRGGEQVLAKTKALGSVYATSCQV